MKRSAYSLILASVLLVTQPAVGLDVTLDSGSGSTTLTDVDADGIIDFDLTVGGVLEARGRVFEQIQANTRILSITSTPPLSEAVFRNLGLVDATFTVIVNSSAFSAVGPPLGWAVFYNGRAADAMGGAVGIPTHSVQALVNLGAIELATLNGPPIVAAGDIDLATSGVNSADAATDMRVVFSFTAGPDDEIRLPDNNSVDGNAIQVSVFNQGFKCVDKMNNFSRKVLDKAQKSDAGCVKDGFKQGGANVTACVDDPNEEKTEKAETKLLEQFDIFCAPNLPAWGVNGQRCCEGGTDDAEPCLVDAGCPGGACVRGACISGAAEQAASETTHGLFAGTINVAGGDTGKCQKGVIKRAGKLLVERWKVFRKCKKDNFAAISDDIDLVGTCLGPPQPDPKNKIGTRVTKLSDEIAKCVDKGVSPVGPAFPGECTGVGDGAIDDCIAALVSCRFCIAINIADDIDPALDCDLFDDGAANASCP